LSKLKNGIYAQGLGKFWGVLEVERFGKVVLLGLKEFHGLHDDLKL